MHPATAPPMMMSPAEEEMEARLEAELQSERMQMAGRLMHQQPPQHNIHQPQPYPPQPSQMQHTRAATAFAGNSTNNALRRPPVPASGPSHRRPSSMSGTGGLRRPATPSGQHAASSMYGVGATATPIPRPASAFSPRDRDRDRDLSKNFKVVVRIRPPLPRELESVHHGQVPYREVVRMEDQHRAVTICEGGVTPNQGASPTNADGDGSHAFNMQHQAMPAGGMFPSQKFTFDHVYDQDAQQIDVYENTARDAVLSTLQGYNATLLAYGQTGTGKTFTMEGFDDHELRGIIPRSVEEIFNYIQNTANRNVRFLVRASYLQIYNEVISDLLRPDRANLSIREDKKRGIFVEGLSEWVVRSPGEVYGLIQRGQAIRATGATRLNETSSRSHALFIIIVEQNEIIYEDPTGQPLVLPPTMSEAEKLALLSDPTKAVVRQSFKVGRLNLVDLAGSERVRISGAKGRRLEESKHINQSLSALGNVISALTEGNRQHIPYRDSKLTRILEDSFGGNVKCTLLAMISPAAEHYLESLSTLKFAHRAKRIENKARINEDTNSDNKTLLQKYERELKKLRAELQAKSQNVVDKRKLIEVEEQRRRAEQDRLAALMNMEKLSRDLLLEKSQKKKLEERIKEMNSQLLVGGHLKAGNGNAGVAGDGDMDIAAEHSKAFQAALAVEHERIRAQYTSKLAELEKEREQMEEEKAQTSRYKQLLLKQRDIMIQLTARLNERDQSILLLQQELDAYDRHQRAMEDELDQKRHRLIQLQRMNVGAVGVTAAAAAEDDTEMSSPCNGAAAGGQSNMYDLFPIDEAPYFEETPSPKPPQSQTDSQSPRYAGHATMSSPPVRPSAAPSCSSSSPPPTSNPPFDPALFEQVREEVEKHVSQLQSQSQAQDHSSPDIAQLKAELAAREEALQSKHNEAARLKEELEQLKQQLASNSAADAAVASAQNEEMVSSLKGQLAKRDEYATTLEQQNATLMKNLQTMQEMLQKEKQAATAAASAAAHEQQPSPLSPTEESRLLHDLRRKYDVQLQERAALKVILEKKMKALIDSIAQAALHGHGKSSSNQNEDASSSSSSSTDALPSRTRREIQVLQRLVDASLTALKNSDVKDEPSSSNSSSSSGAPSNSALSAPPSAPSSGSTTAHDPGKAISSSNRPPTRPIDASGFTPRYTHPSSTAARPAPTSSAAQPSSSSSSAGHANTSLSNPPTTSKSGSNGGMEIERLIQQRKQELQRMDERNVVR